MGGLVHDSEGWEFMKLKKLRIQPQIETVIRRPDGSVREKTVEVGKAKILTIRVEDEKPTKKKTRRKTQNGIGNEQGN